MCLLYTSCFLLQGGIFKSVCLLWILQSQAKCSEPSMWVPWSSSLKCSSLCVCSQFWALARLSACSHTPPTKACSDHLSGCMGVSHEAGGGEARGALGLPLGQLGAPWERYPKKLIDGLLDGVRDTSTVLWWVLSPDCCAPSLSQSLSRAHHLNFLGEVRKKWASWAVSCTPGEARCSLTMHSLSSVGGIGVWGGFPHHWAVLPWQRGDACKVKLFLPSSTVFSCVFFLQ